MWEGWEVGRVGLSGGRLGEWGQATLQPTSAAGDGEAKSMFQTISRRRRSVI